MRYSATQTLGKIRIKLQRKCADMDRNGAAECNKVFVINCLIPRYFTVAKRIRWENAISIRDIRPKNPDAYNAERLLALGNCRKFRTIGMMIGMCAKKNWPSLQAFTIFKLPAGLDDESI